MAVLWCNGFGRSTTARRPAVNFAPGWLGTAPVQRSCVAPSDTAEGLSRRARDRSPCRPHRQRVATPVARNGNGSQHPHTTPSPDHPAATGVSGDGTRKETAAFSIRSASKGNATIHGQPSAVAAHRSRYPAVTATTRPRRSRHCRLAARLRLEVGRFSGPSRRRARQAHDATSLFSELLCRGRPWAPLRP